MIGLQCVSALKFGSKYSNNLLQICSQLGFLKTNWTQNVVVVQNQPFKISFSPCVAELLNQALYHFLHFRDVGFLSVTAHADQTGLMGKLYLLLRPPSPLRWPQEKWNVDDSVSQGNSTFGPRYPHTEPTTNLFKFTPEKKIHSNTLPISRRNADARTTVGVPGTVMGGRLQCSQPVYLWANQSASVPGDALQHDLLSQHDGALRSGYCSQ